MKPRIRLRACELAAAQAETAWQLPRGLLVAVGIIESGRGDLGGAGPVAWPWSINAGGRDYSLSSKSAAIQTVRALQAAGWQAIDVGCFQVDLFYHPEAFPTLEAAFDPGANAQAAARILTLARVATGSWEAAVALYHSALPASGAQYLRRVQLVLPWARRRGIATPEEGYVVMLSDAARQIRVITPTGAPPPPPSGLPAVRGPQDAPQSLQLTAIPPPIPPFDLAAMPKALPSVPVHLGPE